MLLKSWLTLNHVQGAPLARMSCYGVNFPHTVCCSALQYVDALRLGDLDKFEEIEAESGDWWGPLLDRGAGAALHFAVDHGQARPAVITSHQGPRLYNPSPK